jgi:hypothetical protein
MADQSFNTTQYISLKKPLSGSFQNIWDVPLNENWDTIAALFSSAAEVGHTHSGAEGQGPQVDHTALLSIGTYTHAELDTHVDNTALHANTAIGTISGDHANSPVITTVTDVTHIKFTNATVTDLGSGVIQVIAQGSGDSSALFARTQSAPIAWVDNFNWPHGSALEGLCWLTKQPTDTHPKATVVGPATGGPGTLARVALNGAVQAQGYSLNHASCHIPHGTAQRVTLHVQRLEGPAGETIATADDITLTLDLLSATIGKSFDRPAAFGLSLVINKPAGSDTLDFALSLRPHGADDNQEVIWTDFSGPLPSEYAGTFDQLPQDFFVGCHEFSLRRDPTVADAFWLQYYYNEGLVLRKYFDTNSTDQATALFATELKNLVANLGNWSVPQPAYGRMGWGLGYNITTGAELLLELQCVTVCSQDDLDTVSGPLTVFPDGPVDPPVPVESPCCPDWSDFGGLVVGDPWDFDGPGGLTGDQWVITGLFSTEFGAANGEGFEVKSLVDGLHYPVFCAPPTIDALPSAFPIAGYSVSQTITLTGDALAAGNDEHAQIELSYGDSTWPVNWGQPGGSQFFNEGDVVGTGDATKSSTILQVTDMTWTQETGGSSKLTLTYNTGPNLPWGRTLNIKVTPGYDTLLNSNYSATWLDSLKVVPAPSLITLPGAGWNVAYWDDVTDPANPTWVKADVLTPIPEGSWVYITAAAANWPMGATFWDEGNGFTDWSIEDTALGADVVLANGEYAINFLPASGLTLLWSRFTPDTIPSALSGTLPAYISGSTPLPATAFAALPPDYVIGTYPLIGLGAIQLYTIIKLDDDFYTAQGQNATVDMALRNPLTGSVIANGGLPETVIPKVNPRAPVVDLTSMTISTTTFVPGETGVTISFNARYVDAVDNTIVCELTSGWDASMPASVTIDSTGPTMALVDNLDGTVTCTISALVLGTTGSISSTIKNSGISDTLPNEDTVTWGVVDTTTTPVIQQDTLTVKENATTPLTVYVKDILPSASLRLSNNVNFAIAQKESVATVLGKTPDANGFYAWQLSITGYETSGVFPTAVNLIVVNGNGETASLSLTAVESVTPCIVEITVGDATPTASGGTSIWTITPGIEQTEVLYFHTTGIDDTLPDKPTFIPTTANGPGTLAASSNITLISGNPPAAAVWSQSFDKSSDVDETTEITFTSNTASNGDPKTCTLAFPNTIEFVPEMVLGGGGLVGGGTLGLGADTGNGSGSGSETSRLARANVIFATAPEEGHYAAFTVYGNLVPDDSLGTNLTIDFEGETGATATASVVITSASATSVSGIAKFADNVSGRSLRLKVTNATLGTTIKGVLSRVVAKPAAPRIRGASMTPPHEGTTGATITVTGTNLTPPRAPSGVSALSYGYTFFDSATSAVLSSVALVSSSSRQLVFTADVASSTAGETIGIAVNYLGGNTHRAGNLVTILAEETNDPEITAVKLYAKSADLTASDPTPPLTFTDGTCWLRVIGTGLGRANVASDGTGLFIEVVGELDDLSTADVAETPPGPGTSAALADPSIYPGTFRVQSATELIIEVPCTPAYANARVRVHLVRPSSHPDGAVEWDQGVLDSTGAGTALNLSNAGLTARYGSMARAPRINTDPDVGTTHYDVAHAFQANCGAGTEGDTFAVTVRLESAITTADAPAVVAVADTNYGVEFERVVVSKTANPLEISIQVTVPTPGVNNTYPLSAFAEATPALIGLRFANGQPIAAVTLGASDWGEISTQVPF